MAHMRFSRNWRGIGGLADDRRRFRRLRRAACAGRGRSDDSLFRSAIGAEDKSKGGALDPVTEADRAAEVAMRG